MDLYELLDRSQLADGSLLPHQDEGARWLLSQPRALLADDVGLGKTVTAAAVMSGLAAAGELHPTEKPAAGRARPVGRSCAVLVVTEAAVVEQTAAEFRRFLPSLKTATTNHLALKAKASGPAVSLWRAEYGQGPDVVVTSYATARTRLTEAPSALLPPFHEHAPALLVLDEISAVKGGEEEYRAALALSRQARRVLGLGASPYENHPLETWHILSAIGSPDLWPREVFRREFVQWQDGYRLADGTEVPPKPVGLLPHKAAEFRDYFSRYALRRTAEDVGLSLPEPAGEAWVWVSLLPGQRKAYERAKRHVGLRAYQQRQKAARVGKVGEESALVTAALGWLDAHQEADKVIVYAERMAALDETCHRLETAGIGYVRIDGGTARGDRGGLVERFRTDPACRVLVGSSVLERGLNLQFCRVMLSLGATDNPQREWQRTGRIRRIGSPHQSYEHITFAPDTPDERKRYARLGHKADQAARLVGA